MKLIKNNTVEYALSLAAGWAWGVSLIVGMQTIQEKGFLPFIIWAVANSLALPVFGVLSFRIKKLHKVIDSKPVQVFTTLVMVFCLLIQMNAIHDILASSGICDELISKAVPIIISVVMAFGLFYNGILRNIKIDKILWCACYVILFILLGIGILSDVERNKIAIGSNQNDINWALNSCFILFAGPFMNTQNWQMAEKLHSESNLEKSHWLAGAFFGIYMVIVGLLSMFHFSHIMNIFQIGAIICITSTTIDASIVGMQKIAGEKVGLCIALITIICWQFFIAFGVLQLWTIMGNWRKYIATICIVIALIWEFVEKRRAMNNEKR